MFLVSALGSLVFVVNEVEGGVGGRGVYLEGFEGGRRLE